MHLRLVMLVALGGCSALVDGWTKPDDVETDANPTTSARAMFDRDVLPLITTACGGCHGGTNAAAPAWMQPAPDEYTTVTSWPRLVELTAPATSMLLTKGVHQGPAWMVEQASTILSWIELERDEHPVDMVVETNAIDIVDGANRLPLDIIDAPGSVLTFTAQKLTYGLYLSNIAITAGVDGVHFKHPLFVTWQGTTPTPDPVDSFDVVEMDLAQGSSRAIGGGLLMLANVPADAKLSVSFKQIGPAVGSGSTTLPGCKVVTSFTTNARPPLSANCVVCHGGANTGATAAVDMTKINDTTAAGQAFACGQILGRVNLVTPDQSGILLAPDPASGVTHPFKFSALAYPAFKTSLTTWVQAEKAAP